MSELSDETRRNIRRTALALLAVALVFYFGFILMGVVKA